MEPKIYHKKELADLYEQCWDVELDFRTTKTDMGMEI